MHASRKKMEDKDDYRNIYETYYGALNALFLTDENELRCTENKRCRTRFFYNSALNLNYFAQADWKDF